MENLIDSRSLLGNPQALRDRAAKDGYLFIRQLIPAQRLLEVRKQFAAILEEIGWLDAGADPQAALSSQPARVESVHQEYFQAYDRIQKLESFHALAHSPEILAVTDAIFAEKTFAHPRNIARVIFPSSPKTPPHQDFLHIQGTPDTWTCWFPLGDCPRALGSLLVLEGSHAAGMLPVRPMPGAGGSGIEEQHLKGTWRTADFACGDVLLFHSYTIHAGSPNLSSNRLRLSVDFRFQGQSQPIVNYSLEPHHRRLTWEQIYAGWQSKRLQYYWKDLPLNIVEMDMEMVARYTQTTAAR